MANILDVLGITEETSGSLMDELEPDRGTTTQYEMAKRIIEVAQGKPTNEVLYLGVVLALTLKI